MAPNTERFTVWSLPEFQVTPENMEKLMRWARTSDTDELLDYIKWAGSIIVDLVKAAVDDDTKDTLLHIVAANALVEVFAEMAQKGVVPQQMGIPTPPSPWPPLLTRQNKVGNTVLHAAVLSGDIYMTKAVVNAYTEMNIEVPDDPRFPPPSPSVEQGPLDNEYYRLPFKAFINTVNEAGRDALAEAKAHGYSDIAYWLEGYMERLGLRPDDGPEAGYSWEEWHQLKGHQVNVGKFDISINK